MKQIMLYSACRNQLSNMCYTKQTTNKQEKQNSCSLKTFIQTQHIRNTHTHIHELSSNSWFNKRVKLIPIVTTGTENSPS